MVISAGITMPTWLAVRSLYSLQNAMMLTPWGPSAVPMGGAGLAFPAGICSFTTALTRFAMLFYTPHNSIRLDFLDLKEIQNDWRLATEKRDQHCHLVAIHVDIADGADKFGERAIDYAHALAFGEADLGLRLLGLFRHLLQDGFHLMFLKRNGASARAHKAGDAGRVAHNIPGFVAHDHLHQHIAGEDFTLYSAPLALLDLHLFFHWHDDPKILLRISIELIRASRWLFTLFS